jgi:hypothetical protein
MSFFSFLNPLKNDEEYKKDKKKEVKEAKGVKEEEEKKPHKKPTISLNSKDETVDFSIHYKNKVLTVYLYIKKKGVKETWKAKLNEEEMNKLLYNLFFIFSNPEPFQQELQSVYPDQQLEKVININPNPPIHMEDAIEKLTMLLHK